MSRTQTTNLLLTLVVLALLANLVVMLTQSQPAYAVRKSDIATEATDVANKVAMDRVLGDIGPAVREMARSNQEVAGAIREHARATREIARAIEKAGAPESRR